MTQNRPKVITNDVDTPSDRFESLVAELQREFRTFRLITKEDSPLMRALFVVLGMKLWNPIFISHYTTVIGSRVYMPYDLIGTDAAYATLRHERVHMRDFWSSGVLPFVLSYLFVLPAGLTLRAVWEMRAYRETMRVELEDTGRIADRTLDFIQARFVGPDYLYMLPFPRLVRAWLERTRARLISEKTIKTNS